MTRLPQQFTNQQWPRTWPQQEGNDQQMLLAPAIGSYNQMPAPQSLGPSFMMTNSYTSGPNYDSSIRSQQYDNQMSYDCTAYSTPSPLASQPMPFRSHQNYRSDARLLSPASSHGYMSPHSDGLKLERFEEPTSTPMSRSTSHVMTTPVNTPMSQSKIISPIIPDDPKTKVEFHTPVDDFLRKAQVLALSPSASSPEQLMTPAQSPRLDHDQIRVTRLKPKPKTKVFPCPKCPHISAQKAHYKTHLQTHTGDKPHICHICGSRHSQKGNLEGHLRAHKNERIYKCLVQGCGKDFTASGSLNAHKRTHDPQRRRYLCKLQNCSKDFSTTGNMKNHHTKFHEKEIERLSLLVTEFKHTGYVPDEDRKALEHLIWHYRNSNKGIKGRGKGIKVAKIASTNHSESPPAIHRYNDQSLSGPTSAPIGPLYQGMHHQSQQILPSGRHQLPSTAQIYASAPMGQMSSYNRIY